MVALPDLKLEEIDDNWVCQRGVPVFDEHTNDDLGVHYDRPKLERIAANNNARAESDNFCPLIIGHNDLNDKKSEKPIVGYARDFTVEDGEDGPVIKCDFYFPKAYKDVPLAFARRSIELWGQDPEEQFFDPIALLGGTTPRLDIGQPSRMYRRPAGERPVACYEMAAAGPASTFVPSDDLRKKGEDPEQYDCVGGSTNPRDNAGTLSQGDLQQIVQALDGVIDAKIDNALRAVSDGEPTIEDGDIQMADDSPMGMDPMDPLAAGPDPLAPIGPDPMGEPMPGGGALDADMGAAPAPDMAPPEGMDGGSPLGMDDYETDPADDFAGDFADDFADFDDMAFDEDPGDDYGGFLDEDITEPGGDVLSPMGNTGMDVDSTGEMPGTAGDPFAVDVQEQRSPAKYERDQMSNQQLVAQYERQNQALTERNQKLAAQYQRVVGERDKLQKANAQLVEENKKFRQAQQYERRRNQLVEVQNKNHVVLPEGVDGEMKLWGHVDEKVWENHLQSVAQYSRVPINRDLPRESEADAEADRNARTAAALRSPEEQAAAQYSRAARDLVTRSRKEGQPIDYSEALRRVKASEPAA